MKKEEGISCEALEISVNDFARYPPDVRLRVAAEIFGGLLIVKRAHSKIVRMAMLLPPTGEIKLALSGTDQEGKLDKMLSAIRGACSHELKCGVWSYERETQKFLLNFARESGEKEDCWKEAVLEDFKQNSNLGQMLRWVEYCEGIKIAAELFDIPQEVINKRLEDMILSEIKEASIDHMISIAKSLKMLTKEFGLSEWNIQKSFYELIAQKIEDQPLECMRVVQLMDYSISPLKLALQEQAIALLTKANSVEDFYVRQSKVKKACSIYETLEKNFGVTSGTGTTLLTIWGDGTKKDAVRDVLRKASVLLQFPYEPHGIIDHLRCLV